MNDPDFDPNYNSIIVLEKNIRIAAIPKDEIEIVRQVLNGYARKGKCRNCAVVVPNERQEIFLKLNLELIRPIEFNIRVFYREDEALNWIKAQPSRRLHRGLVERGVESIVMSFIVQRPQHEPGFRLHRQEAEGRMLKYTTSGYSMDRA